MLRDIISKEFPEHGIVGKEEGTSGNGRVSWFIDPINGTRPFICGIPVWGTLIGLIVDGTARMGLMSQPSTPMASEARQQSPFEGSTRRQG